MKVFGCLVRQLIFALEIEEQRKRDAAVNDLFRNFRDTGGSKKMFVKAMRFCQRKIRQKEIIAVKHRAKVIFASLPKPKNNALRY